jgi:hypothetical protein
VIPVVYKFTWSPIVFLIFGRVLFHAFLKINKKTKESFESQGKILSKHEHFQRFELYQKIMIFYAANVSENI